MAVFHMNMNDYPHCTLNEGDSLRTIGRHCPGLPRELLSALIRLDYDGPIGSYRCRCFQAHGLNVCEVWVEIPLNPMAPWRGAVIHNGVDDVVENMAHVALTSLCECSLAVTVDTWLALFPIHKQEQPEWQQRHEAMCDITSQQFSFRCSHLAKYTWYFFNL
jgi:hypothetical protein